MDEDFYADAVLYCYTKITEHLIYDNITGELISRFIVTVQEKQDLDALQIGSTSRAGRLLDLILSKKRNIKGLVDVLKEKQKELGNLIEEQRRKILSGDILPSVSVIQQFQRVYDIQEWNLIEKLPGESFTLDISDESQLMPLDVVVEIVDKALLKKQVGKLKRSKLVYKYKSQTIPCIEEMFTGDCALSDEERALENQFPSRLFLCTGVAGTGKTVTLRRFAWQWAKQVNKHLEHFHLVIIIPLSKVNRELKLLDLLGPSGLKYIDESQKDTIDRCLKWYGKAVLFALDGADEVDIPVGSDLCQLIAGELYPEAKVFIMTRPDSKNLSHIESCKPDVKFHIKGTNMEGIYKHIMAIIIKRGEPSKEDADHIITQCNRLMFNFDLLYIPMYLSIITILFDQHWVKYASFSHFQVPGTITTLFNSFMSVIIKLWMRRTNCDDDMVDCTIKHSPVEKCSKIPVNIRAKLVNMGHMSFECLLRQKYFFSESDLQEYLVDEADVIACGMFKSTVNHKKGKVFTFHHQIFQQYLGAVYLSHMKMKDSVCRDHVQCQTNTTDMSQTLEEFFSPLQLCMKFLFGMVPELGVDILQTVLPFVKLGINEKGREDGTKVKALDLVYEAELCSENEQLIKVFEKNINSMGMKYKPYDLSEFAANFGSLRKFLQSFSKGNVQALLQKVYNLHVVQDSHNRDVWHFNCGGDYKENLTTVSLANLDVACYCLLSKLNFPSVTDITVEESMVMDVKPINLVFPGLCNVKIRGRQELDIDTSTNIWERDDQQQSANTNIKVLQYKGDVKTSKLPKQATLNLFNMAELETLEISKMDIFSDIPVNYKLNLGSLKELIISKVYIKEQMCKLCHVLRCIPTLSSFQLKNPYGDTCNSSECRELMKAVSELPKIDTLALVHTFDKDAVITMCDCVKKFKQLKI